MTSMRTPLAGVVVIAIEQAVAAPFCTARLADAGARVIKIERPEGDFARGYDEAANGQSSYFVWLNRGKESLVLDLRHEQARLQLWSFVESADVFVQNLKPGALEAFGFDIASVRRKNPSVICCSISGYGDHGPLASRKAYDLLIQAESGLSSVTGGPEMPSRVGISLVDIATGASAYSAILEALIARGTSQAGADIRISLFDVIAEWLTVPLLNHEAGTPPKRIGLAHPSIAPYGVFATSDDRQVLIAIQNDREWTTLCAGLLGGADLAADRRFATNIARVRNRSETDAVVSAAIRSHTRDDLVSRLDQLDIAFAEVNDMAGLAAHPHLRRFTVDTAFGAISLPAPGPMFVGEQRRYGDVPALGQNKLHWKPGQGGLEKELDFDDT